MRKRDFIQELTGGKILTPELKNWFHAELIFISSNIEEIKISRQQARKIVAQYPQFKPVLRSNKDLLQAKGQKIALEFGEELASKKDLIDIYIIKEIHKMITGEAWSEIAGVYRQENVEFRKSSFLPPHYSRVPEEMYFLDQYLLETQKTLLPENLEGVLEFATSVHYRLVSIHPFRDGNGRVARVVYNLIFRRYGYPYVLLPKTENDRQMWQGLQLANKGDLSKLIDLGKKLLGYSYGIVFDYWQKGRLPK